MAKLETVFTLILLNLLWKFTVLNAYTHWIVTEEGLVKAQLDSDLNLQRPYDLMGFIQQEQRIDSISQMREALFNQKVLIDSTEDKETDLESKFYKTDKDCIAAGKPLTQFDLYISTMLPLENKGFSLYSQLPVITEFPEELIEPDCISVIDLPFSMHAWEHLPSMSERKNLTHIPEIELKATMLEEVDILQWGHQVYEGMKKSNTSWLLFNLAAVYWRVKGDAFQAVECLRRALHFSPREHKDMALVSLANILHRAQHSEDALLVLQMSLEISPNLNVNHFTLGNTYAVLGDYNSSVSHFESFAYTLSTVSDFAEAGKRKHAVLCHSKLEEALEEQHRSLQRTLAQLRDYQIQHEKLVRAQNKLIAVKEKPDRAFKKHLFYEKARQAALLEEQSDDDMQACLDGFKENGNGKLNCLLPKEDRPATADVSREQTKTDVTMETTEAPQEAVESVPENVSTMSYQQATMDVLYRELNEQRMFFDESEWPDRAECLTHVHLYPYWGMLPPVFLPAENKGYEVKSLLSEAQGIKQHMEHSLPWFPPHCDKLVDIEVDDTYFDNLWSMQRREEFTSINEHMHFDKLKSIILSYVNSGDVKVEDIGQRILTAIKTENGPLWTLYNLAGLYWQILGNPYQAIECYRRSLRYCPPDVSDVPKTNLAQVLFFLGKKHWGDAAALVEHAIAINNMEPVTNYILGNIKLVHGNSSGAIHHYQVALRQDPDFQAPLEILRVVRCYSKFKGLQNSKSSEGFSKADDDDTTCEMPESQMSNIMDGFVCTNINGVEHCTMKQFHNPQQQECTSRCKKMSPSKSVTKSLQSITGIRTRKGKHEQHHLLVPSCADEECNELMLFLAVQNEEKKCPCSPSSKKQCKCSSVSGSKSQLMHKIKPPTKTIRKQLQKLANQHAKVADSILGVGYEIMDSGLVCENCGLVIESDDDDDDDKDKGKHFDIKVRQKQPKDSPHSDFDPDLFASSGSDVAETLEIPEILNILDDELPDNLMILPDSDYQPSELPSCSNVQRIDLNQFASTWLAPTTKNVDVTDHIDFTQDIGNLQPLEPHCPSPVEFSLDMFDHLTGIAGREQLAYIAETGLKDVLEMLGGKKESPGDVGTRIALALDQNSTSWVANTMAALYWRVHGDAVRAIECLRQALHHVPRHYKEIPLVCLANVLHRSMVFNNAIVVNNAALELAPNVVVIRFTMANIYAAKGDLEEAVKFYEATLSLQSSFKPAYDRLMSIFCHELQEEEDDDD